MDPIAIKNGVIVILAAMGTAIAQALGGWDTAIFTLVACMGVDYFTGLMVAVIWHNSPKTESGGASSSAGLKGFARKFGMLLIVGMAYLLDRVTGNDYIRTTVILFFIANECLSILENGGLMGIKYPKFLKNALEVLRDQADGGSQTDGESQAISTTAEIINTVSEIMNEMAVPDNTSAISANDTAENANEVTEKPPDVIASAR